MDRDTIAPGSRGDPTAFPGRHDSVRGEEPDVSVVVPSYRGVDSLEHLVVRVCRTLRSSGSTFELVIVVDASPDGSWRLLQRLCNDWPEVRAIDLLGNQGQQRATLCGLAHARGAVVVTVDDDLQHPPEEIPRLLKALADDPTLDAVIGSWGFDRGVFRNAGSRVHRWVSHIAYGSPRGFRHTAFRAIRRPVVETIVAHGTRNPVISALLWQSTRRIANTPVGHYDRPHGRSGFRARLGAGLVLRNLFQASTAPLRLLAVLGFTAATLAALVTLIVIARWLAGADPPAGWMSVFLATMFFGGSILIGLGLLGEYMALVIAETKAAPRWAIRSELPGAKIGREIAPSAGEPPRAHRLRADESASARPRGGD